VHAHLPPADRQRFRTKSVAGAAVSSGATAQMTWRGMTGRCFFHHAAAACGSGHRTGAAGMIRPLLGHRAPSAFVARVPCTDGPHCVKGSDSHSRPGRPATFLPGRLSTRASWTLAGGGPERVFLRQPIVRRRPPLGTPRYMAPEQARVRASARPATCMRWGSAAAWCLPSVCR
jgi:hypothetical protein